MTGGAFYYSIMNLYQKNQLNLDSNERGTIMSLMGIVGALSSAFIIPIFSKSHWTTK